jgi:hypothetical protein
MSPWLIAIPVLGGAAYLIYNAMTGKSSSPIYTTVPTVKALVDGGDRAQQYLDGLDYSYLAYEGIAVWGGDAAAEALKTVAGTLDVVEGMAKNDLADGNITKNDMANITDKINTIKLAIS